MMKIIPIGILAYLSNMCTCLYPKRATTKVRTAIIITPTEKGNRDPPEETACKADAPTIELIVDHPMVAITFNCHNQNELDFDSMDSHSKSTLR